MDEWVECKISDIGTVVGGATPSTKKPENYEDGKIAWITPKDLSTFSGRYIERGERNITEVGLKSCSTKLLPKNTVLFSSRAPIGYVAIAANEVCTNQGFKSVIPNENTDPLFLFYLLKYNKDKIEGMGSGTTFKEVSGNTMKNIVVSVPRDKSVQKKIADILSSIDDKIEENGRINNNLEQQAQALFKSWFVDFELFNKTKPSDWTYGTIQDLASEIVCGKTPSTKKKEYYGEDIPFITIPDMHNSVYTVKTERSLSLLGADSQPTKTLPKNSICVSCIGTAGLVTLVSTPSQTNQQINSIIPKKNVSPYFVYLLMKTKTDEINKYGQSGSTIVNLNKTQFAKLECIIPSTDSLIEFNNLLEPLFNKILVNMRENIALTDLRDTLLPKLMSGELDVSNIDI
ncbi:restriction endonuclease subunit S [Bulleidia sp. HCP3S3_F2]|uniref:restriction endonuclease subunit S n=1 Tax=unclassified Bulleidia TaxID=2704656 RepID=UPI003F8A8EAE